MTANVTIDLNVRVRGNQTFTGLEDVQGPIYVGGTVRVIEPESGVAGYAVVTEIDTDSELVYLAVEWATLAAESDDSETLSFITDMSPHVLHAPAQEGWLYVWPAQLRSAPLENLTVACTFVDRFRGDLGGSVRIADGAQWLEPDSWHLSTEPDSWRTSTCRSVGIDTVVGMA
ncbi:hypothetical protein SAMN04488570_0305 [Nocardioides scoriae]|uniref:Uncharacterized protein n=1 Tax=Nocardioides scoriae TaxID=642780 RepID=A0A1H1LPB1_9ACTN|nr:hypothetical protein [Nocardioides scoriae]SDR76376.1 hypothetical protein SAMN04488570_0305 [Nocardioides scoriae]